MQKYISTNYLPAYLIAVVIIALSTWVFNINVEVKVMAANNKNHVEMRSHPGAQQQMDIIREQQIRIAAKQDNHTETLKRIEEQLKKAGTSDEIVTEIVRRLRNLPRPR